MIEAGIISPSTFSPRQSMHSLSAGLRAYLSHLERHGLRYNFDVAMVIGGGAFRHYFFTPEDNHAWLVEYPNEFWREDTTRVENYGLYEAVQGHTGWSARRWTKMKGAELVTLLRHEQKEGRFVRLVPSERYAGGLIEAFEASREGLKLTVRHAGEEETLVHPDLTTLDEFVWNLGELQTLRREPGEVPATRRHALTADVLRWAVQHWGARREIIFDVEAYYAAGNRAWLQLRAFASTLASPLEGRNADEGYAYIQRHLEELAQARQSAARFFSDAALVLEHTGREALSAPLLDTLANAWQASADATAEAAKHATPASSEALEEHLELAHQQDAQAFEFLERFIL